ncbi:MAG: ATP-binding cassette domain-containing protein [Sandaracinaceae bacterium]|nr:ATP-binding cassette domain-containing protein [Sandaracinaceae bacterium]
MTRPARGRLGRFERLVRLWDVLRPHLGRFWIATVALAIGGGIGLVYPQAARYAVDQGLSGPHLDLLAAGLLALFVVQAALTWVRHYQMSWLGQRAVAELRRRVFARLLELEPAWFHQRSSGEIVGRLASDVTVVEGVVGSELSMALRNGITLLGGVALLFVENARLTGVMLLVVPPLALSVVYIGRRIRQRSRAVQDRLAEASARVQEAIGAVETVQGFVRERDEAERYAGGVEAAFEAARRLAVWRGLFMSAATFAGFASIALILWVGGHAVARGEMTSGSLTAFMLYTTMVAVSLGALAGLWGSLQRAAGATDRLFEIIDTVPAIQSPASPTPLPAGGGEVRIEGVRHAYAARPDVDVLDGVDLVLAPGETVALVGRSGAGKTTLAKLLPRFFDPRAGRVRLDGVDVRELALEDLRGVVATVAQEPVLFSGTLEENIAYGARDATRERVEAAARDAHLHELVAKLPDGYATRVGERGVALSGGQRQRVAIARALLADPRVLVLDEATSHLDAESEAAIQKALDVLLRGRTALIIAHRLSTVRRADRIVVLDEGRVVEEGRHEALMAAGGLYRRLVELQLLEDNGRDENQAPGSGVGGT